MHIFVFFLLFFFMSFSALPAMAQGAATSCDPDFMGVLEARSWMQGKREIETAQALLHKSDSVLDYSCFRRRVVNVAVQGGGIFSDRVNGRPLFHCPTFRGGDSYQPTIASPGCGPDAPGGALTETTLDGMLQNLVLDALDQYRQGNYNHRMGGGFTNLSSGPCDLMNDVWKALKCENMNQGPVDGWLSFAALSGRDPRSLPESCNEADRSLRWQTALAAANPAPASPARSGGMDAMKTLLDDLQAGRCGSPVLTGLKVFGASGERDDALCIAPGCYFNGTACVP